METPVRRRLTNGRDALWIVGNLLPVMLVLLAWGWDVDAQEKSPKATKEQPDTQSVSQAADANDPNELWWSRWDVRATDPNDPNKVLEAKWDAVLGVLEAKDLDQEVKERIIDRIVSPVFDFPLMGRLALGRMHWPKLNPAQREKFVRLFVTRLKALYLKKTSLYKDEKVSFRPAILKRNVVHIPVVLISEDKKITMLYKLHKMDEPSKTNERWKIHDLEIEGVSILLTYRSQFDDILRRGTVEDLLSSLEKPPSQ